MAVINLLHGTMSNTHKPMSNLIDFSSTTEIPFAGTNSGGSGGELQNLQATYRLNGKNYLKWSQLIHTFQKGKRKLSHLLGIGPNEEDPTFTAWDEKDSLVMSWLWNSMVPKISYTVMFLTAAKDIWEAVKFTYTKVHNATQIYEIRTKVAAIKQGIRSIIEYANLLQTLWQELDHYQCLKIKCSEDVALQKRFVEKERTYDFLVGLNMEFDAVRV